MGIIFGGVSCEHDISIITAKQLIANIDEYLYRVIPIYINKYGKWYTGDDLLKINASNEKFLKIKECVILPSDNHLYIKKFGKYKRDLQIDCAIICMHGINGEDGAMSGLLNLSNVPYVCSDIVSSAVCMDKCIFKTFCKGLKMPIIDGFEITYNEYVDDFNGVCCKVNEMSFPIIIKPSRLGSSIGIEVCKDFDEFLFKVRKSFKYDEKLLVEKFVKIKKELNIALVCDNGEIIYSQIEEPKTNNEILNFDDKYKRKGFCGISRVIPAEITVDIEEKIKEIAFEIFKKLELFGVVRFDFILDEDDNLYINEVNSIPGSMANYLFKNTKYSYSELITLLIKNAIVRNEKKSETIKVFDTGVKVTEELFMKK